jgi:hypothetical protein
VRVSVLVDAGLFTVRWKAPWMRRVLLRSAICATLSHCWLDTWGCVLLLCSKGGAKVTNALQVILRYKPLPRGSRSSILSVSDPNAGGDERFQAVELYAR